MVLYLFPIGRPVTSYILKSRGQKLVAYLLVATGISFSSISFQTIVGNRFLTPGVLGLETVYVLLQTILYWGSFRLVGAISLHPIVECMILIGIQSLFFLLLQPSLKTLLNKGLMLVLLICMSLGTLLRSLATFIQVTMDPNEYDQLQSKLFPSFQRMNSEILGFSILFLILLIGLLWRKAPVLDVLHLGSETATILGVEVVKEERLILWYIAMIVATVTAIVGPLSYLGFLVSNVTYRLLNSYRHRELFVLASLLGFLVLLSGQFIVERFLGYRLNISMIVELIGGMVFFYLIFREKKRL
ncbi:iron chelate uptake ABC transporter family permease subunit [Streptococcus cameli]